ncbi:MAG TPA: methionyl-tRNA formyltransferase [Clostridiales bacterium]|nr:methionyl-tRNA formyltransferase [Clostridiales bacterium]
MKVLFMGTPDFASNILKNIIEENYNVIAVITQPDKQKGRGKTISFSPVKELAIANEIPVYQPVKVREEENILLIKELNPDIIIVAAFGQILPKELLDIPRYGCINVHASLLPKYRGAAPIQYSIIDGEDETGITIMYMDVGLDTGDIISQESLRIDKNETGGSLFDKMSKLGSSLLLRTLIEIENGTSSRELQDESKSTYVKMINKDMGNIDFNDSAIRIERLIRGLNPWPSAYTYIEGKMLKIWESEVVELNLEEECEVGVIVKIEKDKFIIKTGEGYLAIKEVQLEGKKRMNVSAFLLGYQLNIGTQFKSRKG